MKVGAYLYVVATIILLLFLLGCTNAYKTESGAEIPVTLSMEFEGKTVSSENYLVSNGTTLFSFLNKTKDITYKEYFGMGLFVDSISGIKSNTTHGWVYSVDGMLGTVAMDQFRIEKPCSIHLNYSCFGC